MNNCVPKTDEKQLQRVRNRYQKLKSEGRCVSCGAPTDNQLHCEACLKAGRWYNKDRHTRLLESGICVRCGKSKAREGYKSCESCAIEMRLYWRAKRTDAKNNKSV